MVRLRPALSCLCLLFFLGLGACAAGRPAKQRALNADVLLVSFGSVDGELADCGCHSHPKGGLPWRAGLVDSLTDLEKPLLQLDLGNFAPEDEDAADFKMRFLWEKMADLGVQATTPGGRELNRFDTYRELMASGWISVVSSNLKVVEAGAEKPLGTRWVVIEINGVRIGLIGLIGKDEFASAHPPSDVEIRFEDPFAIAAELIAEVQSRSDVVVLLSEMSTPDTDRLLATFPGIDVALYGNRPPWNEEAIKVAGTIVQQTGIRGQYVGLLTLIVAPDGEIVEYDARNAPVDRTFGEDPEMKAAVDEAQATIKTIEAAARERRQSNPESGPSGPGASEDPSDALGSTRP